jgi:hypothetical protein
LQCTQKVPRESSARSLGQMPASTVQTLWRRKILQHNQGKNREAPSLGFRLQSSPEEERYLVLTTAWAMARLRCHLVGAWSPGRTGSPTCTCWTADPTCNTVRTRHIHARNVQKPWLDLMLQALQAREGRFGLNDHVTSSGLQTGGEAMRSDDKTSLSGKGSFLRRKRALLLSSFLDSSLDSTAANWWHRTLSYSTTPVHRIAWMTLYCTVLLKSHLSAFIAAFSI